jgi:L-alanine-DL-glutamate epimerase-like enolase superfamily enzyme
MNRRNFLASSALGLAGAANLFPNVRDPGPGAAAEDAERALGLFSRTTLTTPITRVASASTSPVVIDELTLARHDGAVFLFVRSADGARGVARGNLRHPLLLSLLEGLVMPFFLGKDARRLEHLLDEVYVANSNYKYAGMPFHNCVALVELACLDLLAGVSGRPVHDLLGEKLREDFPVYLSRFPRGNRPEHELADVQAELERTGARAVKVKIGARMGNNRDGAPGRSEALIPLLRERLPAGTTLYVDANGAYDVPEAIRIGRMLQAHGYGFFEEPCPWQEFEATKAVADALEIPVAGGEQDSSAPQFAWYLRHRGLDVVQPDLLYNGGMIRSLRVAKMVEAAGAILVPHSPGPEFWPYLAHFAAVAPALGPFLEQIAGPQIKDGRIRLPEATGWGWDATPRGEVLARIGRATG